MGTHNKSGVFSNLIATVEIRFKVELRICLSSSCRISWSDHGHECFAWQNVPVNSKGIEDMDNRGIC